MFRMFAAVIWRQRGVMAQAIGTYCYELVKWWTGGIWNCLTFNLTKPVGLAQKELWNKARSYSFNRGPAPSSKAWFTRSTGSEAHFFNFCIPIFQKSSTICIMSESYRYPEDPNGKNLRIYQFQKCIYTSCSVCARIWSWMLSFQRGRKQNSAIHKIGTLG